MKSGDFSRRGGGRKDGEDAPPPPRSHTIFSFPLPPPPKKKTDPETRRLLAEAAAAAARAAECHAALFRHLSSGGSLGASRKRTAAEREAAGAKRARDALAAALSERVWREHHATVLAWHTRGDKSAPLVLSAPPTIACRITSTVWRAIGALGVRRLHVEPEAELRSIGAIERPNATLEEMRIYDGHLMTDFPDILINLHALTTLAVGSRDASATELPLKIRDGVFNGAKALTHLEVGDCYCDFSDLSSLRSFTYRRRIFRWPPPFLRTMTKLTNLTLLVSSYDTSFCVASEQFDDVARRNLSTWVKILVSLPYLDHVDVPTCPHRKHPDTMRDAAAYRNLILPTKTASENGLPILERDLRAIIAALAFPDIADLLTMPSETSS